MRGTPSLIATHYDVRLVCSKVRRELELSLLACRQYSGRLMERHRSSHCCGPRALSRASVKSDVSPEVAHRATNANSSTYISAAASRSSQTCSGKEKQSCVLERLVRTRHHCGQASLAASLQPSWNDTHWPVTSPAQRSQWQLERVTCSSLLNGSRALLDHAMLD
jgi:hypothetical protein